VELFSIEEVLTKKIKVSRPMLYRDIKAGRLKTVKIGTRRFVTEEGLQAYQDLLVAEAEQAGWG